MNALWQELASLIDHPQSRYQLLAIVISLVLAALLARGLRRHTAGNDAIRTAGARRLAFPLIAIALLSLASFVTHHFALPTKLLRVAIQLLTVMAGLRMTVFALRRLFSQAAWLPGFERLLVTLVWLGVMLNYAGVLPEFIDWLDSFELRVGRNHVTLWQILQGAVTVVMTALAALWLAGIVDNRLTEAESLDANLKVVFSRLSKAVLLFFAVLTGMSLAGLDITTLSVFGGALGVGLGFGMQKIAANYVSGFIILLDRSIRLGNIIQVGPEQRGEVTQITTRYTVVRSLTGVHYIVPNETLVGTVVQNETFATTRTRVVTKVQVGYRSDVERALAMLVEIASQEPRVLADPPPKAFLLSFDDSGITLELGVWISDPLNGTGELKSNINRAILRRFNEEGIEIPFPQREVRVLGAMPSA